MSSCPRCGSRLEREWSYCPRCGNILKRDFFADIFSAMRKHMREINKEMQKTDKLFEKDFEVLDISPYFRKPRTSGFSIKIVQSTGKGPRVSVRTFGNVNKENIRKQVQEQLKGREKIKIGFSPEFEKYQEKGEEKSVEPPKTTEEPKTVVKRQENKVLVNVEIPDVKSMEDIEVTELENSVEVRARAKEKAYFKIITKPANTRLINKTFSKDVLSLEFS